MGSRVTILGSGGSMGTPVISCRCPTCLSKNLKDKRLRASILLQTGKYNYIIDPGPDVRQAALLYKIDQLDGIFLTHAHEDHIGGLNDLRPYHYQMGGLPLYCVASQNTWDIVSSRFYYLLDRFNPIILQEDRGSITLNKEEFGYFSYMQKGTPVTGYRFKDFAYVTDIKEYPETIFSDLKGVNTLIVSALHGSGTPMHFSHEEAILFGKKVGAKRVLFTHINHETLHDEVSATLPNTVELAYDGMEFYV